MKHIEKIEPIETLSLIQRKGLSSTVMMLAKKFLPDECVFRLNYSFFRLDILIAIGSLLIDGEEIDDLRNICRHCPALPYCEFYNN